MLHKDTYQHGSQNKTDVLLIVILNTPDAPTAQALRLNMVANPIQTYTRFSTQKISRKIRADLKIKITNTNFTGYFGEVYPDKVRSKVP